MYLEENTILNDMIYKEKYVKYRIKYLNLKDQYYGGEKYKLENLANVVSGLTKLKGRANERVKIRDHDLKITKCTKIHKYVNLDLNIQIFGTADPWYKTNESRFTSCINLLVKEEIVFYITFNSSGIEQEKLAFNRNCNQNYFVDSEKGMCNFFDLIVEDYKPPTLDNLIKFWLILDVFFETKLSRQNILLHCSAGHGRTGFMIMSYIWLKQLIKDEQTLVESDKKLDDLSFIENFIESYNISDKTVHENINGKDEVYCFITIDDLESFNKIYNFPNDIRKTKTMLFLQNEIFKYWNESWDEIFLDKYYKKLFIDRINMFIQTYKHYKTLTETEKTQIIQKLFNDEFHKLSLIDKKTRQESYSKILKAIPRN